MNKDRDTTPINVPQQVEGEATEPNAEQGYPSDPPEVLEAVRSLDPDDDDTELDVGEPVAVPRTKVYEVLAPHTKVYEAAAAIAPRMVERGVMLPCSKCPEGAPLDPATGLLELHFGNCLGIGDVEMVCSGSGQPPRAVAGAGGVEFDVAAFGGQPLPGVVAMRETVHRLWSEPLDPTNPVAVAMRETVHRLPARIEDLDALTRILERLRLAGARVHFHVYLGVDQDLARSYISLRVVGGRQYEYSPSHATMQQLALKFLQLLGDASFPKISDAPETA